MDVWGQRLTIAQREIFVFYPSVDYGGPSYLQLFSWTFGTFKIILNFVVHMIYFNIFILKPTLINIYKR